MTGLTIVTPTYNRADCLKNCYESLKNQTSKDFQWLVIDDGSNDDTKDVMEQFAGQDPGFGIDYIYKENGGKHTAINLSHEYIKGRYVLVLDSDDTLTEDAVQYVLKAWEVFGENPDVGRIIFLKGYTEDKPICYVMQSMVPVDSLKEERISISGRDCCDTFRTELFKKHKFPVFEGERFIGEGAGWLPMEFESLAVYVNRVIYLCDYREDGLTKAGRKMRILNPQGGRYNSMIYMDKRLPLKTRIKKGMLYVCYSCFLKQSFLSMIKDNPYKVLTTLTIIPGYLLYRLWNYNYL